MNFISTTLGDGGETGLLNGDRIQKDHPRVEAIGDLDELSSCLGAAKCQSPRRETRDIIEKVQHQLMGLMGGLALPASESDAGKIAGKAEPAEAEIRALAEKYQRERPVTGFVLPGASPASASLDIARTVCRRAERRIVALNRAEPVHPAMLRYINRLSDLLFVLARSEEGERPE